MTDLKTNYVDDVLDTSKNEKRKYRMETNEDGTVSFVDVTEYIQVGDSFGSKDVNEITSAVGDLGSKISHIGMIIQSTTLDTEEKVKEIYGGDKWERITGRFLIGAGEDYDVSSMGGYKNAIVVEHSHTTEPHTHTQEYHTHIQAAHVHTIPEHSHKWNDGSAFVCYNYGDITKGISERSVGADAGTNIHVPAINSADVDYLCKTNVQSQSLTTDSATPSVYASQAINNVADVLVGNAGKDGTGRNIPPYKAVYIWERTA